MKIVPPGATAGSDPATISRALAGEWAQILPNSETCSSCKVVERADVATDKVELFLKISPVWVLFASGYIRRISIGRLSYANLTLLKILRADSRSCAITTALKFFV